MLTGWRYTLSKLFIIPQRYVLGVMSLLGLANAYTMRVCLNLAITQMVTTRLTATVSHTDECPAENILVHRVNISTAIPTLGRADVPRYQWDEATQGFILSAFYYGYLVTQIPGSILIVRWGGKWVMGLGMLVTAVGTLITPFVVEWGGSTALFALRVVEGLGEGPTLPAMMDLLANWTPVKERGIMVSLAFGGAQIGNIAGSLISGILLKNGNWHIVFYFFGIIGIFWCMLWALLCFNSPSEHPFVSDKEREFLKETVDHKKEKDFMSTPWKSLLTSMPVWALIFAAVGHDYGYYTMVSDLPKYMTDVLKFNVNSTGLMSALPYLAMWISGFVFGAIGDHALRNNWMSLLNVRRMFTTIAALFPGICIVLASYVGCNRISAVALFTTAMTLMGAYYTGVRANILDLAPNYTGPVTALTNVISSMTGVLAPTLIGLMTPDQTMLQWRQAFWICLAVLVLTNVIYLVWAKGEQMWWDDAEKHADQRGKHKNETFSRIEMDSETVKIECAKL